MIKNLYSMCPDRTLTQDMPFMISSCCKERHNLEAKARRAAAVAGCSIVKSKVRPGGYRLMDRKSHQVIAGDRFDLSAEDVLSLVAQFESMGRES